MALRRRGRGGGSVVSVEWFDLGARLLAAREGHVARRLERSPVTAGPVVVAVRAVETGGVVWVSATDQDGSHAQGSGTDALAALGRLGVRITAAVPVTLVVDDAATLPLLVRLARSCRDEHQQVAAHIGWWSDRGDFPGGRAVVDVREACRSRWATGEDPAAEQSGMTWARWLGVTGGDRDSGLARTLALHRLVAAGEPLRFLDLLGESHLYAWERAQTYYGDGRDWRLPDTRGRAARGLRERCDAADLYAAALLTDRLWRRRAVHTGHVVTGHAVRSPGRQRAVEVTCDRLDARLRIGSKVTGWPGSLDREGAPVVGEVTQTRVLNGALVLTVMGATGLPGTGEAVVLHESPPAVGTQRRARSNLTGLYASRRSWLTTGRAPTPTRRDVPLSVLIAGAETEEGRTP